MLDLQKELLTKCQKEINANKKKEFTRSLQDLSWAALKCRCLSVGLFFMLDFFTFKA